MTERVSFKCHSSLTSSFGKINKKSNRSAVKSQHFWWNISYYFTAILDISLSVWDIRITNSSISFEQWVRGQELCYICGKFKKIFLNSCRVYVSGKKNHELLELNCGWPISLIFTSPVPAASSFTLCLCP